KVRGVETLLPDVRLWDAGLRLSEPAGRIHLDWKPLPAEAGTSPTYSAQLLDASSRGLLWTQPATPTGGDVDNRMVEDVRSTASAAVTARLGDVRVSSVSTSLDVTGRAGPPPSRGRPCLAVNAPDLSTTPQAKCGATDGNLAAPTSLAGNSGAVVSGVVVDLGSARRVTLVVVRGLGGDYVLEGSSDGTTYSQLASGSTSPAAFPLATPPTARFVRVRSPSGLDESLLAEVSVWESEVESGPK
ncbi:MAG: hypothetical protein M3256_25120, partial [Actinomycetota bacterium]|nr:hypothetical protein [Actinomycetota bacterium]